MLWDIAVADSRCGRPYVIQMSLQSEKASRFREAFCVLDSISMMRRTPTR
jgi:hypothetical protein